MTIRTIADWLRTRKGSSVPDGSITVSGLDWLWWDVGNDIHGIDGSIRDCPRRVGSLSTGNLPIAENDLIIVERPDEAVNQRVRVSIIRDVVKDVGADGNDPVTALVRVFDEDGGLSILRWRCGLLYFYGASQGDGTEANPYIVNSPASLQRVSDNPSAHYIQTADIDLSGISWKPLCHESGGFTGSYDGQGHSITNMNMENWNKYEQGLFSVIGTGARVKNLFIDGEISANYSVSNVQAGMLAGKISGATITNVHTHGNILIINGSAGGFAETIFESTIEQCSFVGSVQAYQRLAGFCCYSMSLSKDTKISNCYAQANLTGSVNTLIGGFFQANWSILAKPAIIDKCYCAGTITPHPLSDVDPAGFASLNQGGTITGCVWDVSLNPTLQNPDPAGVGGLTTDRLQDPVNYETSYSGWDFDRIWHPPTGTEYPLLRGE